jgi:predicted  nucleic acid-binding Zn-ribbon protein
MKDSRDLKVHVFTNRTMCEVLEEIRKLDKVKNYSGLLGLVEEIQSMANRMESALHDQKDVVKLKEGLKELKKEYKKALQEYQDLEKKLKKLDSKT